MASDAAPEPILARLGGLHPKLIDLSLTRIERLLAALDHPERKLPPVLHVAGTNGKGSVVAFLRAILEAHGKRVHVYTSPHLVRFNERIRVAGAIIDDERLAEALVRAERANAGAPITFFEITTAAAFLAFSETPADFTLLEVGLGGRLDATNVIEHPLVAAITPLSIDHTDFLGPTLAAIAGEKAGILKRGVPAVIAAQAPEAARVIDARAQSLGASLFRQGREWSVTPASGGFHYQGAGAYALPPPALPGAHQLGNAGQAIACVEHVPGLALDPGALARGLAAVEWPARLQRLARGPLVAALPPGWELWLDGGHNPGAGAVLATQFALWRERPLYLIYGMLTTKDAAGYLAPLAAFVAGLHAVTIPGESPSMSAQAAAAAARAAGIEAEVAENPSAALTKVMAKAKTPARVLICGSLYLAGWVLRDHG
ncbi:MAG: bifunctional folylpolyglutamate synthase/dihydrofolate synthase [Alphaproteobacteria bacterium]|nr:bifunctional folylpolyglutamate synthase/dihydrofolate synthase [Alphaproteobacteria bacterium]